VPRKGTRGRWLKKDNNQTEPENNGDIFSTFYCFFTLQYHEVGHVEMRIPVETRSKSGRNPVEIRSKSGRNPAKSKIRNF
jgi:hypothetical protein